ncbi:MAG: hypothetical protein NTX86_03770 [Candidatus Dependentiae bacterium]|nr:hypothetical protein [Candidatus Dependentiae bacterium]
MQSVSRTLSITLLMTLFIVPSLFSIVINEDREQKILDLQLEEAIENNDPEKIKRLYAEGANGSTSPVKPAAYACLKKSSQALDAILRNGGDYRERYSAITISTSFGKEYILKQATNSNDNSPTFSPLELADNDPQIIQVFKRHGIKTTRSNSFTLLKQEMTESNSTEAAIDQQKLPMFIHQNVKPSKKSCWEIVLARLGILKK